MEEKEALLNQLKSVHLPEVSGVPAIGWWVLAVIFILLSVLAWWLRNRYVSRQWQREAAQELSRIRDQSASRTVSASLSDTSRLARRILLAVKPRAAVASLHGSDWLDALDDVCDRPLFANGFGELLLSRQYQRDPQVNPADMDALFDIMDELIRCSGKAYGQPSSSIDSSSKRA